LAYFFHRELDTTKWMATMRFNEQKIESLSHDLFLS